MLYSWTARSFDGTNYSALTTRPDFVATSTGSNMTATRHASATTPYATSAVNPWGCQVQADYGHASLHDPEYILAEAHTNCVVPPSGVVIEHQQSLYRSSWSGWRSVGYNDSFCDSGGHSSGQPIPQCNPDYSTNRTRAWVWWNCVAAGFRDLLYNYRHVDVSYIRSGDTTYSAFATSQTGAWYEDGNVQCGFYLP